MKNQVTTLMIVIAILTTGCAKIYYSGNAMTKSNEHKIVAIVPPVVSIAASKKVDGDALIEQQRTESMNFQREMYSWMLKRKMKGEIKVNIQDPAATNALLNKAGMFDDIASYTPQEIADALGVDGLINSNYAMTKPISTGGAIALTVLGFGGAATNQVTISLSISNGSDGEVLYNYQHVMSAGLGSNSASIVNTLMKKASKKMPYIQLN